MLIQEQQPQDISHGTHEVKENKRHHWLTIICIDQDVKFRLIRQRDGS